MPEPRLSAETVKRYRFADLTIESNCPISSLVPAVDGAKPSITIGVPVEMTSPCEQSEWLHAWIEPDTRVALLLGIVETAFDELVYRLRFPGQCDFLMAPARGSILIETLPGFHPSSLEHLLIDQALPRLMAQRGALMVHASVVRMNGQVALFLGRSGWGKSTLASLLHQTGHIPLSDDCARLRIDATHVRAIATYPSLRLYEDSIANSFAVPPNTTSVAGYNSKRRLRVPMPSEGNNRIGAIYLLNDPQDDPSAGIAIDSLAPSKACMALVEHNFRLDVTAGEQSASLLAQAAAVSRMIPAYALRYPRDYSNNEALMQTLLEHFSSHSARSS